MLYFLLKAYIILYLRLHSHIIIGTDDVPTSICIYVKCVYRIRKSYNNKTFKGAAVLSGNGVTLCFSGSVISVYTFSLTSLFPFIIKFPKM